MVGVVWLDPALENVNAGDEIISNAIGALDLPALAAAPRLTTHRPLRLSERRLVSRADVVVLGGTNALSSHMERFRQWLIDPDLAVRLRRKVVFLGVGWWQYQDTPCTYTRALYRFISHPTIPHAARDHYTSHRLGSLGLRAMMTGCPTTWGLGAVALPPLGRSSAVVTTLTDYYQDPGVDSRWLLELKEHYAEVRMVGMGPGDRGYFDSLDINGIEWFGAGVDALSDALPDADFVGTRLHAGVHAMQAGRPALILAVDNRALEMRESIGLPVIERRLSDTLGEHLANGVSPTLRIPDEDIARWRTEFRNVVR